MSDLPVSGLPQIVGSGLADGDKVEVVDVSDLSIAPTGRNKNVVLSELAIAIKARLGLLAADVSNFDAQVHTSRLDQMAAPNTNLSLGSHRLTNVSDPAAASDADTQGARAAAITAAVSAAVTALIAGAPAPLDTLNELAAAIGNDATFSATVASALAAKADASALAGKLDTSAHAANSIPASLAGTLADLAVGASTFLGRQAAGNVTAMTVAQAKTLLAIATGDVSGFDTQARTATRFNPVNKAFATSPYAPSDRDLVVVDLSSGNVSIPLPTAPVDNYRIAVLVNKSGNTCTVSTGGSDTFLVAGGATSKPLTAVGQYLQVQYQSAAAVWLVTADVLLPLVGGYGTAVDTVTPGNGQVAIDVQTDVQTLSGSGTWTKPSWVTASSVVEVECVGAGAGGGGGARGIAGTVRGGGGGGASGCRSRQTFLAGDLTNTVAYAVGTGGTGGAGATVDGSGSNGNPGGATTFGKYVVASGGLGGLAGTASDGGLGGTTGARGMWPGMPGGKGGGVSAAVAGSSALFGTADAQTTSGAGGGGGGFTAANGTALPGAGGAADAYTDGSTGGGAASAGGGIVGANGAAAQFGIASGGGGGFRGNGQNGSTGGTGGAPGGGGGGGGGALNPSNGGAGNAGGDGTLRVVTRP